MDIIVCIKPVPDISIISLSGDGEPQLDRDDLIFIVNQSDLAALELALQIKEQVKEGKVVLVSMTPPSNQRLLRRCLALGADEAICIWDRDLTSSDSHITGMILASAIAGRKYDLILAGQAAADTNDGQVGYEIANLLDIPVISAATEIQASHHDKTAVVERKLRQGYRERLEVTLPALVSVDRNPEELRYASLPELVDSLRKNIRQYGIKDIGLSSDEVGEQAGRRRLVKLSPPKPRPRRIFTPDSSLSADERKQLIMSGGLTMKNQELFEGSPETLSVKFTDYLEQLNIDWGVEGKKND